MASHWTARSRLEDVKLLVQKAIDSMPPKHLQPPSPDETFDLPDEAWTRLQNYAFSQGFAMATGQVWEQEKGHSQSWGQ